MTPQPERTIEILPPKKIDLRLYHGLHPEASAETRKLALLITMNKYRPVTKFRLKRKEAR